MWPEEVKGGEPGVRVAVPATRLVETPEKVMPLITYVDSAPAGLLVLVPGLELALVTGFGEMQVF